MTTDSPEPKAKSPGEMYATEARKVLLQRWFNEDSLVNQRLTWLLLAQGLLFAAYGTLATKLVDSCGERAKFALSLIDSISLFGIVFSVTIFIGIVAAIAAQLILHFQHKQPQEPIGVSTVTTIAGWLTGIAVPLVFLLAWLIIPRPDLAALSSECPNPATVPTESSTTPLQSQNAASAIVSASAPR